MRVLVTGVSGFVGSHVARVLSAADCQVLGLVRPSSRLWRLTGLEKRVEIARSDLSQPETYRSAVEKWQPQACIHLAWYAEPGSYLYSDENLRSLQDSLDLFRFLKEVGCKTVVMTGTCAEYNTELGMLNENSQTKPTTLYAASKLALSLIVRQLATAARMNFAWARFFYIYGPREDERRLVPAAIQSFLQNRPFASTKGEQVRDYLYVEDLARALWLLAQAGANDVFNISSGDPITIANLLSVIGTLTGKTNLLRLGELDYRAWEPMYICGDNSRLRSLGWEPQLTLKDGLQKTIDFWKSLP